MLFRIVPAHTCNITTKKKHHRTRENLLVQTICNNERPSTCANVSRVGYRPFAHYKKYGKSRQLHIFMCTAQTRSHWDSWLCCGSRRDISRDTRGVGGLVCPALSNASPKTKFDCVVPKSGWPLYMWMFPSYFFVTIDELETLPCIKSSLQGVGVVDSWSHEKTGLQHILYA